MSDKRQQQLDRIQSERRGTASRNRDYKAVLRQTGDRRAATWAYCRGNKWLEENFRDYHS